MTSRVLSLLLIGLLACASARSDGLPAPVTDDDFHYAEGIAGPLFRLGQLLFFDTIISGNRNISCASCHQPGHGTGDGLPLAVGEGALGGGSDRNTGLFPSMVRTRVARNSQPLFNLGAIEFKRMFHDGRVEKGAPPGRPFLSPAGDELPRGLDNVLAAQAMFPVVSPEEMAGQDGENSIANAVADNDLTTAWMLLADRLRDEPDYFKLFRQSFSHVNEKTDLTFVDAANALAAFQAIAWRADQSPFDRYLRGDATALGSDQRAGMQLFYGRAGCSGCHSGPFQTDHGFHAIGVPQIGPGRGQGFDGHEDFGREVVSWRPQDRYRFRTPSLRNVEVTGPWGHSGAFPTLEGIVRHHIEAPPVDHAPTRPLTPHRDDLAATDFLVWDDHDRRRQIESYNELAPVDLQDDEVEALLAFLSALTDEPSTTDHALPACLRFDEAAPVEDSDPLHEHVRSGFSTDISLARACTSTP